MFSASLSDDVSIHYDTHEHRYSLGILTEQGEMDGVILGLLLLCKFQAIIKVFAHSSYFLFFPAISELFHLSMVSSAKNPTKPTKKRTQFIVNYTAYILHSIHKCKWTKQTSILEEFTASVGHCLSIGCIL